MPRLFIAFRPGRIAGASLHRAGMLANVPGAGCSREQVFCLETRQGNDLPATFGGGLGAARDMMRQLTHTAKLQRPNELGGSVFISPRKISHAVFFLRRFSQVYKARAAQMQAKVTMRVKCTGSPYRKTPRRKTMEGVMYWTRPRVVMRMRRAP